MTPTDWHGPVSGEGQAGYEEKALQAVEQAPQGIGHGTELTGVQKASGQCSQSHDLIFGWSRVETGVGFSDPYEFLPSWDILRFYEALIHSAEYFWYLPSFITII